MPSPKFSDRDNRVNDIDSLFSIHKKVFVFVEQALGEMDSVLRDSVSLEDDLRKKSISTNLSSELERVLNDLSSYQDQISGLSKELSESESDYLNRFNKIVSRIEKIISPLDKARSLAIELDRASRSGFNLEYRMLRRLGIRDIVKTIGVAQNQLVRLTRLSTAKVSSYRRSLSSLIAVNEDRGF